MPAATASSRSTTSISRDLFARFGARGGGGAVVDHSAVRSDAADRTSKCRCEISIEDAYRGTTLELQLSMPEYDEQRSCAACAAHREGADRPGRRRRPATAPAGQGRQGIRRRDATAILYLDISLKPHPLYRANGHDLYIDLPLTPLGGGARRVGGSPDARRRGEPESPPRAPRPGRNCALGGRGLPRPARRCGRSVRRGADRGAGGRSARARTRALRANSRQAARSIRGGIYAESL